MTPDDEPARDFYTLRYADAAEALQHEVFAEVDPGYFGRGSWTSTAGAGVCVLDIASGGGGIEMHKLNHRTRA
jgi:hypothetical protein